MRLAKKLLQNEHGSIHSTEYILLIVLLAIGGIVGLATLRDQVTQELADAGVALETLDQSYFAAVPGMGYSPMVPFDFDSYMPGDMTHLGHTVSYYNDRDPMFPAVPTDPDGDAPAGMVLDTFAAAGQEKLNVDNSDGDSDN